MPTEESLTIGGVAKATGVNVETIRYYQRRGLLPEPPRRHGQIRRYDKSHVSRMNFIREAQRLGFKLTEITDLLKLEDGAHCSEASALAAEKLHQVRDRLDSLRRVEKTLSALVDACAQHSEDVSCPLIESLHRADSPSEHKPT